MITHQYFFFFLLFLGTYQLSAQSKVVLSIGDLSTQEEMFCVPVLADSFPDIVAAQFSLVWDPAIIRFSHTEFGDNPLSLQSGNIFSPSDSTLGVSWIESNLMGITLPPSTSLLSFCFTAQVAEGSSPISFDSYLLGEFIQANTTASFPYQLLDGSVTIQSPNNVRAPEWATAISLFPNPSTGDYLEISGPTNEINNIRLLDSSGRFLQQVNDTAASRFFVGHLPNGTYWLVLQKGTEVSAKALIIQR